MKKTFKEKDTNWHIHFAWYPVFVCNGFMFDSIAWLRQVERRWVEPFSDGFDYWPGFYQYKK